MIKKNHSLKKRGGSVPKYLCQHGEIWQCTSAQCFFFFMSRMRCYVLLLTYYCLLPQEQFSYSVAWSGIGKVPSGENNNRFDLIFCV